MKIRRQRQPRLVLLFAVDRRLRLDQVGTLPM
jgi:hypothetical protein